VGCEWIAAARRGPLHVFEAIWGEEATVAVHLGRLTETVKSEIEPRAARAGMSCEYHGADDKLTPFTYSLFAAGYEVLPSLALFPFYLLHERQPFWDALVWGRHHALALAGSRVAISSVPRPQSAEVGTPARLSRADLNRWLPKKDRVHTRIAYFGEGHAAARLLLSACSYQDYQRYCAMLVAAQYVAPIQIGPRTTEKMVQELWEALKSREAEETERWFVVSDIGDLKLKQLQNEGATVLEFEHGVPVTVGVGFTVMAVPWLLGDGVPLCAIADVTAKIFSDTSHGDMNAAFEKEGLEIAPDLLARLSLLGRGAQGIRLPRARAVKTSSAATAEEPTRHQVAIPKSLDEAKKRGLTPKLCEKEGIVKLDPALQTLLFFGITETCSSRVRWTIFEMLFAAWIAQDDFGGGEVGGATLYGTESRKDTKKGCAWVWDQLRGPLLREGFVGNGSRGCFRLLEPWVARKKKRTVGRAAQGRGEEQTSGRSLKGGPRVAPSADQR